MIQNALLQINENGVILMENGFSNQSIKNKLPSINDVLEMNAQS